MKKLALRIATLLSFAENTYTIKNVWTWSQMYDSGSTLNAIISDHDVLMKLLKK